MRLDDVQAVSRMQDLDMIIGKRHMTSIEWQAAIVNYCHGIPTDLAKDLLS